MSSDTGSPHVQQPNIKINGTLLDSAKMDRLIELEVNTTLGVPAMFMARFHDPDLSLIDGYTSSFPLGGSVEISIEVAETGEFATLFKGEITAIEPDFGTGINAELIVRGYDKSHRLNRAVTSKVFVEVTDSDVMTQLINSAGLSPTVDSTTTVHKHIFQDNQTDLAFLHKLARRNGFEVLVDDRTLYCRAPSGASRTEVALEWGQNLEGFRPRMSIAKQVATVIVKGWDPSTQQAITGQATSSDIAPTTGISPTLGGSAANSAFGGATAVEVRRPVAEQSEAEKLAKAILDQINSSYIEAEGVAIETPKVLAGCKVNITRRIAPDRIYRRRRAASPDGRSGWVYRNGHWRRIVGLLGRRGSRHRH